MKKLFAALIVIGVLTVSELLAGPPAIPPYKPATQAEMEAGTETALRSISPANVKQAIDALGAAGGDITGVLGDATGAVPFLYQTWTAFSAADATPNVSAAQHFKTADTTTYTDFDDGGDSSTLLDGQWLHVLCLHAASFDFTSSGLHSMYGVDYTATVGQIMAFQYDSGNTLWRWMNPQSIVESIADPDADRIYFWDDSESAPALLAPDDSTIEISTTTLQVKDGGITSAKIATIVDSIFWDSGGMVADGTQCADPAKVTINSGPAQYTIICADNDASTMYGHIVMPDSWDGGTVTLELEYLQTAADTNVLNADVCMQCRGAGETVNSTWGTEVAIDDAAVSGSNIVDHTTSGAVTPNGTCAAGDTLYWRVQLDATGTTTAVATLHFLGAKVEYTSNVGD